MSKKIRKPKYTAQAPEVRAMSRRLKAQFFRGNRWNFIGGLTATLLFTTVNLVISWLLQEIIDAANGSAEAMDLLTLLILTISLATSTIFISILNQATQPRFIEKAMSQYKDMAFAEISRKSISSFAVENTSTYLSALSNDAASVENNYVGNIFPLIMNIAFFIGAFSMMVFYSPILTLVAVGLSLFPIIGSMITGNKLPKIEKVVSEKNEGFMGMLKDMLTGFSVVKSFKAEREMIKLFKTSNEEVEASKKRRRKVTIIINMISGFAGIVAQFGVFLFGAYLALNTGEITAGVVIVFVQLMNFVLSPISDFPQLWANRKSALALIDKLALALTEQVEQKGVVVNQSLNNAIELNNINFGYEEDNIVLKDVSVKFEAGKSYALVGGSGSGKSTLLNLLMGSYLTYEGEILFDGNELKEVNLDSLYDLMSIIQQNVFVFDSNIKNNITMFKDFDEQKIQCAIKQAGLAAMIEQKGMDYACGENGNGLSGGERQRISIARCLLKGSSVMLVDEATAALDVETAVAITNSILDIKNLTKVIVTHRLEECILKKYDKIFVMQNGGLIEQGTFDELMQNNGYFRSLYMVSQ